MIRLHVRGNRTKMQHLFKLIEDAKYVCWNRKRENSDVLRDIFWAQPDSVKLLNLFLIVLILDSTFKTNKYIIPLLEIFGMTSTEKKYNPITRHRSGMNKLQRKKKLDQKLCSFL